MENKGELGPIIDENEIVYTPGGKKSQDYIGAGAYGEVYKAKCRGATVAVKIPKKTLNQEQINAFKHEVEVMAKINHPNIALYMGAHISTNSVKIVSELLDGDFGDILLDTKKHQLSLYQRMVYAKQAAEGMAWLHGAKIIHCDYKPSNLLWDKGKSCVKVCDFGLSVFSSSAKDAMAGTPLYISPEIWEMLEEESENRGNNNERFFFSRDVYAFGIGLYQFIKRKAPTLDVPFNGVSEFRDLILSGERPVLPKSEADCPKSLLELTHDCWHQDPLKRPTFTEILERFDRDVLVDCAIIDPNGRKFWKENFFVKGKEKSELRSTVPWKEFIVQFQKKFNLTVAEEKCIDVQVLKELFCSHETVTLENFGRIVGFFFPLIPINELKLSEANWVKRVVDVVKKTWFFGGMDKDEAFKIAKRTNKMGDFLLRFSGSGSNWVLTYVGQKNSIYHTRILHPYASDSFTMEGRGAITFKSIGELIENLKSTELIDKVCEGHPYSSIFSVQGKDAGDEGYAELDFDDDN